MSAGGADALTAAGAPVEHARAVAIMLHGRGSTAEDILSLTDEIGLAEIAYLAPQAPGLTCIRNPSWCHSKQTNRSCRDRL